MKKGWILGAIAGAAIGAGIMCVVKNKKLHESGANTNKYLILFRQMNQYLITKQMNKNIEDYFKERGIKTIAIYGMSHIGQRIIDDLESSEVKVLNGIDRRAERMTYSLPIYAPEEELPNVDAVVVTASDFNEIAEMLAEKMDCDILAFGDVIYNL